MLIEKLPYYKYTGFLKRFRVVLLIFIMGIIGFSSLFIKDGFVYSDKSLWLNGSKEYSKLLALQHPSHTVNKLIIDISEDGWSLASIEKLKALQLQLKTREDVISLNSLFEQTSIFNNALNDEQSMVEIVSLFDVDSDVILDEVTNNSARYVSFIDNENAIFYIVSDAEISLDDLDCSYPYEHSKEQGSSHVKDILLFSILFVILAGSFTIAFKSILPTILGVVFIAATTVLTVALYQWISPAEVTHISIVLLAVTVSVMDFVYIYYKWHVLQRHVPQEVVLYRVITKTYVPIFWTTFVSVVGIGSLILVDSQMLHSMGLNIALSSFTGFLLAFTLLPVMLSFFKLKSSEIITKDGAKYFADKEAHYQKKWLKLFLILSGIILVYSLFMYFYKPMNVMTDSSNTQIQLALSEKGMTDETLLELQSIQSLLQGEFCDDIASFDSAYTEIRKLALQEYPAEKFRLQNIDVDAYAFMFDLYDVSKTVMVNDHLTLNVYLKDAAKKAEILNFIRNEDILIQDRSSLLDVAKMDSINTLFVVVFFVLFVIMSIIYHMTKTMEFVAIALLVNAIPLTWFFAAVMLLDIPLSTEMLVSMIITVALSSDATMHFIFYYYNNRLKPRSSAKILENSFLYIGTPLGMGNVMLILTFIALIFVPDRTISNIGIYSSLLVVLSLGMELFVLPVLFLHRIKSNRALKGYYHGK